MIYINDIPSFRDPESCEYIFDDRIEKIELINGNAVQDYGYVQSGDSYSIEAFFSMENFLRIQELQMQRQLVTFTDEAGAVWENMRMVFRRIKRDKSFKSYIYLTFELWRV